MRRNANPFTVVLIAFCSSHFRVTQFHFGDLGIEGPRLSIKSAHRWEEGKIRPRYLADSAEMIQKAVASGKGACMVQLLTHEGMSTWANQLLPDSGNGSAVCKGRTTIMPCRLIGVEELHEPLSLLHHAAQCYHALSPSLFGLEDLVERMQLSATRCGATQCYHALLLSLFGLEDLVERMQLSATRCG